MSLTELEATKDLRRVERALQRRERVLGKNEAIVMSDEITETDKRLFGRPVRFEIDVCAPVAQLKADINDIRLRLAECIKILEEEKGWTAHDRRFSVHRKLSAVRAGIYLRRKEREVKGLSELLKKQ